MTHLAGSFALKTAKRRNKHDMSGHHFYGGGTINGQRYTGTATIKNAKGPDAHIRVDNKKRGDK